MIIKGEVIDRMKKAVSKPVPIPTHRPAWRHATLVIAEVIGVLAAGVGLILAFTRH